MMSPTGGHLARLVLLLEGSVRNLNLEELAESVPALPHSVDEVLGGTRAFTAALRFL